MKRYEYKLVGETAPRTIEADSACSGGHLSFYVEYEHTSYDFRSGEAAKNTNQRNIACFQAGLWEWFKEVQ